LQIYFVVLIKSLCSNVLCIYLFIGELVANKSAENKLELGGNVHRTVTNTQYNNSVKFCIVR